MIKPGERLDLSFVVKAVVEGELWQGRFAELIVRPTFVSVYMKNNTGSCDAQMEQLGMRAAQLDALGYGLLGLSKDTAGSHRKYAERRGLGFPLVSDPDYAFGKATDSLVEKRMYGKAFFGPTRSAYLLDSDGVVLGVVEKVEPKRHGEQLLELARSEAAAGSRDS